MIQPRQQAAFAGKPFGKRRDPPPALRENFWRDESFQSLLPGLEDKAHAALADQFEDFELRKRSPQFPPALARGWAFPPSVGIDALDEHALGTKPLRAPRRESSARIWDIVSIQMYRPYPS